MLDSRAGGQEAGFRAGERVRIVEPEGPYTGCRGTVIEASGPAEGDQLPLGYYVAVDGENGLARPFLARALQRVAAISARPRRAEGAEQQG